MLTSLLPLHNFWISYATLAPPAPCSFSHMPVVHDELRFTPSQHHYAEFLRYVITAAVNEMVNSTKRTIFIAKSEGIMTFQTAPISSALSLPSGSKLCTAVEYTGYFAFLLFFFFLPQLFTKQKKEKKERKEKP